MWILEENGEIAALQHLRMPVGNSDTGKGKANHFHSDVTTDHMKKDEILIHREKFKCCQE